MVSRDSFILKHKTISFAYETTTALSLFEVNSIDRHFPSGHFSYTQSPQTGSCPLRFWRCSKVSITHLKADFCLIHKLNRFITCHCKLRQSFPVALAPQRKTANEVKGFT
jgi:hypothetical protein